MKVLTYRSEAGETPQSLSFQLFYGRGTLFQHDRHRSQKSLRKPARHDIWGRIIGRNCDNSFPLAIQSPLLTDFPPPSPPLSKSGLKLVCNVKIVYGNLKSEKSTIRLCIETSMKLYVHEFGFWSTGKNKINSLFFLTQLKLYFEISNTKFKFLAFSLSQCADIFPPLMCFDSSARSRSKLSSSTKMTECKSVLLPP